MSRSRQPNGKNARTPRRILLAPAQTIDESLVIPTWWLKTIAAIFLLPIAGLLTLTLFSSFSEAAARHSVWATEEFWFFALGAVIWTLTFFGAVWLFGEPRPLRVYVFGHELTHAIWVWLMGGRVSEFRVSRDGGHILTDTHNFWIALAPYFYPLYSIAVIALYGAVSVFYDVGAYTPVLFGLLGLTWAFHISFTFWMIPKGQSDLSYHGTVFSLVIIYLMNLLLLMALLIIAAPELTWQSVGLELLKNTEDLADFLWRRAAFAP